MRTLALLTLVSATAVTAAAGCGGGDPADVAGTYSVALTNRENGCMLETWEDDGQTADVAVVITQADDTATAVVQGPAGGVLTFWLGSATFIGPVDSDSMSLILYGENSFNQDGCAYTINATIDATIDGDFLEGTISYEAATVDNPACAPLEGCASVQAFNGTRPPR
jgi:hypothetical protein